ISDAFKTPAKAAVKRRGEEKEEGEEGEEQKRQKKEGEKNGSRSVVEVKFVEQTEEKEEEVEEATLSARPSRNCRSTFKRQPGVSGRTRSKSLLGGEDEEVEPKATRRAASKPPVQALPMTPSKPSARSTSKGPAARNKKEATVAEKEEAPFKTPSKPSARSTSKGPTARTKTTATAAEEEE
ncbi:hypothetical protein PENTCL1PPCAC_14121, partial [Pristionchus entomophagus]